MKTDGLRLVATYQCNYNCKYCLARDVPHIEGKIEESRLLKCIDYSIKCGASEFAITGGEPSLVDLTDYIDIASRHFGKISLLSNCTSLTEESLASYVDLGLTNLSVNMPCIDSDAYAKLTGADSACFDHVTNVIKLASKLKGLVLRLNCVLVKGVNDSPEYIDRYIHFATKYNVKQLNFSELIPAQDYAVEKNSPIVKIEKHLINGHKAEYEFALDWGLRCYTAENMSVGCFQYPLQNRSENQPQDYYVTLFIMPDGHLRYNFWNPESIIM